MSNSWLHVILLLSTTLITSEAIGEYPVVLRERANRISSLPVTVTVDVTHTVRWNPLQLETERSFATRDIPRRTADGNPVRKQPGEFLKNITAEDVARAQRAIEEKNKEVSGTYTIQTTFTTDGERVAARHKLVSIDPGVEAAGFSVAAEAYSSTADPTGKTHAYSLSGKKFVESRPGTAARFDYERIALLLSLDKRYFSHPLDAIVNDDRSVRISGNVGFQARTDWGYEATFDNLGVMRNSTLAAAGMTVETICDGTLMFRDVAFPESGSFTYRRSDGSQLEFEFVTRQVKFGAVDNRVFELPDWGDAVAVGEVMKTESRIPRRRTAFWLVCLNIAGVVLVSAFVVYRKIQRGKRNEIQ